MPWGTCVGAPSSPVVQGSPHDGRDDGLAGEEFLPYDALTVLGEIELAEAACDSVAQRAEVGVGAGLQTKSYGG